MKQKNRPGNTLDYYNEEMSHKAVGRLFASKLKEPEPDLDDPYGGDLAEEEAEQHLEKKRLFKKVRDYPLEDELSQPTFRRQYVARDAQPQTNEAAFNPEPMPRPEHRPEPIPIPEPIPEPELRPAPRPEPRPRQKEEELFDEEYDFGMYRRKEKRNTEPVRQSYRNSEPVPFEKPKKPVRRTVNPAPVPVQVVKPKVLKRTNRHLDDLYNTDKDSFDEGYPGFSRAQAASVRRVIVAVTAFIMLLICGVLVYFLLVNRSRLAAAEDDLLELTQLQARYNDLSMEHYTLQQQYADLRQQMAGQTFSPAQPEPSDPGEHTEHPGFPPDTTTMPPQQHIVQPGESLRGISLQFYGTELEYRRIMDANGIADPTLIQPGQQLTIPPPLP